MDSLKLAIAHKDFTHSTKLYALEESDSFIKISKRLRSLYTIEGLIRAKNKVVVDSSFFTLCHIDAILALHQGIQVKFTFLSRISLIELNVLAAI